MALLPKHSNASVTMAHPPRVIHVGRLFWSVLFCFVSSFCSSQIRYSVCSDGYGKFEAKFSSGVTVRVGPAKNGEFSRRVCEARFTWDKQDLVVASASWIDIDVLGVDLGLDAPVV